MGKNGCKSSAETGHCLGQICFSRTFVMVNWNSWRTGGYEWLMWQKRPAGLGWNFRNEKDKCLIKVCVCVYFLSCWCSLCLCLHAWNQYIHLLWMFLSHCDRLLRDHVGLPCHLELCGDIASRSLLSQSSCGKSLRRFPQTTPLEYQICSNTAVAIKDTKGSPFILNSPLHVIFFFSAPCNARINAGGMPRMNHTKFILLLPLRNQSMR